MRDPAKKADEIVDTYNSRDPERIAKLHGIQPHIKTEASPTKNRTQPTEINSFKLPIVTQPPPTLFHRQSGAKRRRHACSTS